MKMRNEAVVIYAAGKGSRFEGLSDNISKCALQFGINPEDTTITHSIKIFYDKGIRDFYIVIGHAAKSIVDVLSRIYDEYSDINFNFVENEYWNYHGCEYSVCLGLNKATKRDYNAVYLIEGDLYIKSEYISRIVDVDRTSVLLKNSKLNDVDTSRAVVALGHNDQVSRFIYDQSHKGLKIDPSVFIGESAQVWKFVGEGTLNKVNKLSSEYIEEADQSHEPHLDSGLLLINRSQPFFPIFIDGNDGWINMNNFSEYQKILMYNLKEIKNGHSK